MDLGLKGLQMIEYSNNIMCMIPYGHSQTAETSRPVTRSKKKNDSNDMKKFLNRMLGLHVNAQDLMIAMMLDILDQVGGQSTKLFNHHN